MLTRVYAGHAVRLNDEGFLLDTGDWTPDVCEALAAEEGVTLTPEHWRVIQFCREDAANHEGRAPGLRRITVVGGIPLRDLYRLFPHGPAALAARIAGLPKPRTGF